MKKRFLIAAAVVAAIACSILGVTAVLVPQPGVTKANFDRVEIGMTKDQVHQILGIPTEFGFLNSGIVIESDRHIWRGEDGSVVQIRFIDGCAMPG